MISDASKGPTKADEPTHTDHGAPTDQAHKDVGDGTLAGSTPAGLTSDQLAEQARSDKPVDGGTG
ncbi:MAG: hypothetical protein H7Z10_06970 [Gemmatimonadaceae bacterium]|nr:hypothetical protein [Acetobacteraceae bacterium]